jgi:hypothetical protein
MVHWGFGKSELLPLTFQQMRMKFWERISKILTSVWWGGILKSESMNLSSYKIISSAQN